MPDDTWLVCPLIYPAEQQSKHLGTDLWLTNWGTEFFRLLGSYSQMAQLCWLNPSLWVLVSGSLRSLAAQCEDPSLIHRWLKGM